MTSSSSHEPPIGHLMPASEVITRLEGHGCRNITDRLDQDSCGTYPLSSGGFGNVYRGKLLDGSLVAIKTMRIHVNTHETQKPFKHAARELHTWSKCQHPNVVQLLGLVEFRDQIGMVSYWMENGNLPLYLEKNPDVNRYQMSTEVSQGLAYLHAQNIVHGDLKGLNVLISVNGTPMLADFGNAILHNSTLQVTTTTTKPALSPRWAAPELLQGGMHSYSADVYALGMTILETMTGKVPYYGKLELAVYAALLVTKEAPLRPEESIPSNSLRGSQLWSLLKSCWVQKPESRPSADHVWETMGKIAQTDPALSVSINSMVMPSFDMINSNMSDEHAFEYLIELGCTDLSTSVDLARSSASILAMGGSYEIYQAPMRSGALVAVRCSRRRSSLSKDYDMQATFLELYHWSVVYHENIQELLGIVMFGGQLGMVSLWMDAGNLPQYIEKNPSVERHPMCIQLAKGVAYLHGIGMIHGDLKGNNVLVSTDGVLKIIDFRCSILPETTPRFWKTLHPVGGTLRWMAPELLSDEEDADGLPVLRTKQTDIYALGMTLVEIISGRVPYHYYQHDVAVFRALHRKHLHQRPQELSGSDDRSTKMWNLLLICSDHDPSARPDASSVLASLQSFALE